ncbi:MAG: phosphoheptose isomerase [Bacteroidetes bacterium]|nr:phosphoheptose isomerase [Bacteroidota bacterium]
MTDKIASIIKASIDVKSIILTDAPMISRIKEVAEKVAERFKDGSRVYFCGNGGSAADAQHLAAEFTGRFYHDREPLPAEALHVNTSFLTAVANDYSYDQVYERMIKAQGRKGDVLFGISTSGNSKNIILAQEEAKRRGMIVVSLTGETGGKMKDSADYLFNVPSKDTPRIQESHILIGHIICELVEEMMM